MSFELRCECGFVATGSDEAAFVSAAQQHARDVHQIDVPAATLLARATTGSAALGAPGDAATASP